MNKNWIVIAAFSIATVVFWIGLEVFFGLTSTELNVSYQSYTQPIDSGFDEETMNEILQREEDYLYVERDGLE